MTTHSEFNTTAWTIAWGGQPFGGLLTEALDVQAALLTASPGALASAPAGIGHNPSAALAAGCPRSGRGLKMKTVLYSVVDRAATPR